MKKEQEFKQIAKQTNLTRQTISKIINHKVDNPGIKTLRSICSIVGCTIEELGY